MIGANKASLSCIGGFGQILLFDRPRVAPCPRFRIGTGDQPGLMYS